jgi:hypothetical protein
VRVVCARRYGHSSSTAKLELKKCCRSREADARTRTGDPFITSEVLYQLSYVGGGLKCSRGLARLQDERLALPAVLDVSDPLPAIVSGLVFLERLRSHDGCVAD